MITMKLGMKHWIMKHGLLIVGLMIVQHRIMCMKEYQPRVRQKPSNKPQQEAGQPVAAQLLKPVIKPPATPPVRLEYINSYGELRWKWNRIDVHDIVFPAGFLWGVGVAEFQVSGAKNCPQSHWVAWEKSGHAPSSGAACDSWHRMDEDVACAQELGVNAYRFSVEWSTIEPEEGKFNQDALDHYTTFCTKLLAAGIQPMVTLHHMTHPQWFYDLGGFEEEANIVYFKRFCAKVFNTLQDKVKLWAIINEPGTSAFQGYFGGVFPPGYRTRWLLGAQVLGNMHKAHVEVYWDLKHRPGGDQAQIGFILPVVPFKPYTRWNLLERFICSIGNQFFHEASIGFFKTGIFEFTIAPGLSYTFEDMRAPMSFDFIGLNYYGRVLLNTTYPRTFGSAYLPGDIRTDMPYAFDPEGFYQTIKRLASFKKPIYITENGISDTEDPKISLNRRSLWLERYLYALSRALKEGVDVRGYFHWSLIDNYEWDRGYTQHFGLYSCEGSTQKRTLRQGGRVYKEIIERCRREQ